MRSPFNPSGLDDPATAIDFLDHLSPWGSAGQPAGQTNHDEREPRHRPPRLHVDECGDDMQRHGCAAAQFEWLVRGASGGVSASSTCFTSAAPSGIGGAP
jgi:hypothetical protein